MSDLFTAAEKQQLKQPFRDLHDTFGRDIVIWKTAQQVVISTNPSHNFFFESAPTNTQVQEIPVSGTFKARILYGKEQKRAQFASLQSQRSEDQINAKIEEGMVRIKVDQSGKNFLDGANRVTFDGNIFLIDTSPRPHGIFEPDFYTFYLKRVN